MTDSCIDRRSTGQRIGTISVCSGSAAQAADFNESPDRQSKGDHCWAERGIGRLIIESGEPAEALGMMVAVIVLMLVVVALSAMIWRLRANLLRWQQHNMTE